MLFSGVQELDWQLGLLVNTDIAFISGALITGLMPSES